MRSPIVFLLLLVAGAHTAAAQTDAPKYTPEIFGRLVGGAAAAGTNVCLRRAGSEILQCSYTDFDGRFYIPRFGEVRPEQATGGTKSVTTYPAHWLQMGTLSGRATLLGPIELVDSKAVVLHLDCDLTRHAAGADGKVDYCEIARGQPNVRSQAGR
ncbi:MAG: hypothetical protein ABI843_06315 [Dokdonella sp.]